MVECAKYLAVSSDCWTARLVMNCYNFGSSPVFECCLCYCTKNTFPVFVNDCSPSVYRSRTDSTYHPFCIQFINFLGSSCKRQTSSVQESSRYQSVVCFLCNQTKQCVCLLILHSSTVDHVKVQARKLELPTLCFSIACNGLSTHLLASDTSQIPSK